MPSTVSPTITIQPQSQTNNVGTTASFTVMSAGSPTLAYQWRYNSVNTTGASNATLTISNVQKTDEGGYSVVVSNSAGSVTSQSATLTVIIPIVPLSISQISPHVTRKDAAAGPISFSVSAADSVPGGLTPAGSSSDSGLISANGLAFGGSGTNRTVTVTPAPDQFGTATISIVAPDSGGASATNWFQLTVLPVNDPPSFSKGVDQAVDEGSGARTVANWGANLSVGPANEAGQVLTFQLSNNNNTLFSPAPANSSQRFYRAVSP